MQKEIIVINPWIYDFAAYDCWVRPFGPLRIVAGLKERGLSVRFIDCMNRKDLGTGNDKDRDASFGCGKFKKTLIEKPASLRDIDRPYFRYGISKESFFQQLPSKQPKAVLVGSMMTYWYPGAFEVIQIIKKRYPRVPVVLGGIYAALYPEHARKYSRADMVISETNFEKVFSNLERFLRISHGSSLSTEDVLPAYEFYGNKTAVAVRTSEGCPFNCSHCVSRKLANQYKQRSPEKVLEELNKYRQKFKTRDIAFYDDAMLVNSENHAERIFKGIVSSEMDLRLHFPNGLHACFLNNKNAELMKKAGAVTIRLGLETSNWLIQKNIGNKITEKAFLRAVETLFDADFQPAVLGAYTMMGLPGQKPEDVLQDIAFLTDKCGIQAFLAAYSPIPGSKDFANMSIHIQEKLLEEPLYTNNTVFSDFSGVFDQDTIRSMRKIASGKNKKLQQ
ncbi:MAG: B12-binding domain-containing radical SAM protein [Candidatus Theseobacter exili]|nr:B12-binding domain-containing radical SAM protein [Candidatus Theseobacter exili]